MKREITLSSFPVRNIVNNRPGDFTTKFYPEIDLEIVIMEFRIISMAFT